MIDGSSLQELLSSRIGTSSRLKLSNLPHPYLLKDMEKAAERIARSIKDNEQILLVGDYDVDGVTSTAIIVSFFKDFGYDNLLYVIPDRFKDGYGVSPSVLEPYSDSNLKVVFTVDNGISAVDAGDWCADRNIDFIITDHHTVPSTIPKAYAIVDQKQSDCEFPYKEICGAQIAWYLVRVIAMKMDQRLPPSAYTDLVGLAIVADVMPLLDMNRAMLVKSLSLMNASTRPFFVAAKDFLFGDQFTSEELAFKIAPMINAAGRLKNASLALDAFLAPSVAEASESFKVLNQVNEERKEIEASVTSSAVSMVNESDSIIVIHGEDWHEGVVGIVASRLVEKYKKPAIVLSLTENGILKGSGRSLGEVDLIKMMTMCSELFLGFGGHKLAGGMAISLDNFEEFKSKMNTLSSEHTESDFIDKEKLPVGSLSLGDISFGIVDLIDSFEPFGEKNRRPLFSGSNFLVDSISIMQDKHFRLEISCMFNGINMKFKAVRFNFDKSELCNVGDFIDIEYTIGVNSFRGNNNIQLMLSSVKKV